MKPLSDRPLNKASSRCPNVEKSGYIKLLAGREKNELKVGMPDTTAILARMKGEYKMLETRIVVGGRVEWKENESLKIRKLTLSRGRGCYMGCRY
jgi:hypothetical protein